LTFKNIHKIPIFIDIQVMKLSTDLYRLNLYNKSFNLFLYINSFKITFKSYTFVPANNYPLRVKSYLA
ncbi:hypothetical protein, partial [Tenacibaculum maritimum]|uniref:hypothetical protein n=1 Tax=Tenacibaculum maritimum TaxID=107401 RepID=UPI0038772F63